MFVVTRCCFALVFVFASLVAAASEVTAPSTDAQSLLAWQASVRTALEEGKYPALLPSKRTKVLRAQDQISTILADKDSLSELSEADFTRVVNLQLEVIAILENSEDDRILCRREHRVGRFFDQTRCISKRERERMHRESADQLRRMSPNAAGPGN